MENQQVNEVAEGTVTPLVNWRKTPTVRELKQDLQDAKHIHDAQVMKISDWLDNFHVRGKAKPKPIKGNSGVQPKLIRKQAEWRYPALSEPFLSTDDVFKVKPISWEDRDAARQNELVLNNQFNTKLDKVEFIDEFVRTAVEEGTVILRVGWCFEEEEVEEEQPVFSLVQDPGAMPLMEQLAALEQESPSQFATDVPHELKQALEAFKQYGIPYSPKVTGTEMVKVMKVVKNHPTVEVCDNRNVIADPTALGNIEKAGFVVYSFESSIGQLSRDSKYKNLDKVNVSANSILGEPDHSSSEGSRNFNFNDRARMKIVVYEYWGLWDINGDGKLVPIVAAWVGDQLIRLEENPYPDKKHPFISAQYLPVRKRLHGEPDGELLEDNQKIVGAVTRGMIDILAKSANGQTGMRKDMLDATNRRKYENGLDYEFNAQVDPRQGVYMHTFTEIPQSAQFMLQLQNFDAESMSGVKSFAAQGMSGASLGDVAAGIRGALDAASKRELGILRRLSAAIIKVGRKFISMNAKFLSEEEVVRISNEQFVTVRRDDLAGNFDLKLSISTAEEDNNKAEQLAFMYQTTAPNGDADMNKMMLSEIFRLRKMPDLAHKVETYQPQPDPIAQERMMLENELLKAQIAKEQALAQAALATAGLNSAKVGTEQAKAEHLQSQADINNLDFVEQETGTKQERDLQKIGEQARSQMGLKAMDMQMQDKKQKVDLLKEYIKNSARKSKES